MYIVSKLFWYVIQPAMLVLLLLCVGLWRMRRGGGRKSILAAFVLLAASVAGPPGDLLVMPLEDRFPRTELPEQIDGIIVLGGGEIMWLSHARGRLELNSAGDRLLEFLRLAADYPDAKLLHSGGKGEVMLGVGDASEDLLIALSETGLDPTRLMLETESRNTNENVALSKAIAQPKPGETWVMITSAFHMPRSVGIFRAQGWDVFPWPVDYHTTGHLRPERIGYDTTTNLQTTTLALKEWIGLIYYYARGWTNTVFPAP